MVPPPSRWQNISSSISMSPARPLGKHHPPMGGLGADAAAAVGRFFRRTKTRHPGRPRQMQGPMLAIPDRGELAAAQHDLVASQQPNDQPIVAGNLGPETGFADPAIG